MLTALEQAAFEKGYGAGQAQGLEQALSQSQAKLEHFSQLVGQIDTLWQRLVQDYEQQILQLVCRVAQKVVAGLHKKADDLPGEAKTKLDELAPVLEKFTWEPEIP